MSSLTVPISPDLSPACRAENTAPGTVPFIDDAIGRGDEIRLMQDPADFQYDGGIYKKELQYLSKLGYTWESRGTYWIAKKG